MPPKSKKEQQQEAQRLEEERKRKEEQEARLAEERKKFAAEVIDGDVTLIFTEYFLKNVLKHDDSFTLKVIQTYLASLELPKPLEGKEEKLFISEQFAALNFVLRSFGLKQRQESGLELDHGQIEKARIVLGIVLSVYMHNNAGFKRIGKTKEEDQARMKELLLRYSVDKEVLGIEEVKKTVRFMTRGYFQHYGLREAFLGGGRREAVQTRRIVVDYPSALPSLQQGLSLDIKKSEPQI